MSSAVSARERRHSEIVKSIDHPLADIAAVPERVRLGPRQRQIAELAALGQTNDEIARALAISVNTVKARLKEVFERLDVRNRTELALEMRLLEP